MQIDLLLSTIFIFIAIGLNFYVSIKGLNTYKKSKSIGTFLFSISVLFVALGLLMLFTEKLILETTVLDLVGIMFGGIAIILSAGSVTTIDSFAFNMIFPDKYKIFTIIAACAMTVYCIFWFVEPKAVIAAEITFPTGITTLLGYVIILPLMLVPLVSFFYYASKTRSDKPARSKRATLLGLGLVFFLLAYIIETIGFDIAIIALTGRALFIPAIILYYWALFRIKVEN